MRHKRSLFKRLLAAGIVLSLSFPAPVFGLRPAQNPEGSGLEELTQALTAPSVSPQVPIYSKRGLVAASLLALLLGVALPQDQGPLLAQDKKPDAAAVKLNDQIKEIASKSLLDDGKKFLSRQRISDRSRVTPANVPKEVLDRYQRNRGKIFAGFDFNGLFQSYSSDEKNPHWNESKFLAANGRVWIYDTSLGILADISNGEMASARKAVNALVELGKDEQALGFTGGWHFSYNTFDDSWLDPRAPIGNTLWGLKAVYVYAEAAVRSPDAAVRREAEGHIEWANSLVKSLVFEMQVVDEKDKRYGLIRAMRYNGILDTKNPRTDKNYTLDEAGYRAYEGKDLNKISEHVIFEHNADLVDVYRLASRATTAAKVKDEKFQTELARRHELVMNALWEKGWAGDHFVTAMAPDGTLNRGVAVDNNTWVAQVFLPYEEERAWQAIDYVWNNFRTRNKEGKALAGKTGDLLLEGNFSAAAQKRLENQEFAGLFFFQPDFADPYVDIPKELRPKLAQMVQPEGTFGYIHYLTEFARVTKDEKRRDEALRRAGLLYRSMGTLRELYGVNSGLPYSTMNVPLFTTLHGMASTGSGVVVTRLMQGNTTGYIGVDPPAAWTFQKRLPGDRPAPKAGKEEEISVGRTGVESFPFNPAAGLGLLSERYALVNVGPGSRAADEADVKFSAGQSPLTFPAGLEPYRLLLEQPEVPVSLDRFGLLHGNSVLGLLRPDGQSVAGVGGGLFQRIIDTDFIFSRSNQANFLGQRSWQFSGQPSTPLFLISNVLLSEPEKAGFVRSVADGLGLTLEQARESVRFVPADPALARSLLEQVSRERAVVYAALDESSYGTAVQAIKESVPDWTVLLLETSNLRRRFGANELLNLMTDLRHIRRISTYTTFDMNDGEALLISA